MKLHTDKLTSDQLYDCLFAAKNAGKITEDVYFTQLDQRGSRIRAYGYAIQLGTDDKTSGPTGLRHYKNSGQIGADTVYAATYDEWGWFIAEVFAVDPDAIFGPYKGIGSFCAFPNNKYRIGE